MEATEKLLIERGDAEAVSIRAIADAVGVTPPSIYMHFKDKTDLLVAVCDDRFREFDEVQEAAAASFDDPLESLQARGRAYVRFGLDNPEHYRILFMVRDPQRADRDSAEVPAGLVAFGHLVGAVQRCMDAGSFAGGDPVLVATGLWTAVHGITSLLICFPNFDWPDLDTLVDHVLDVTRRGLAP